MIQSFRAELPWTTEQLPPSVEALEAALQPHLPTNADLLRWAVVSITPPEGAAVTLTCEGAWMTTPSLVEPMA